MDSQIGSEGDVAAMSRDAQDSISMSLATFASDPSYAAWFFAKKLGTEWLDPSFQSLYIAGCGIMRADSQGRTHADDGRFDRQTRRCPTDSRAARSNASWTASKA